MVDIFDAALVLNEEKMAFGDQGVGWLVTHSHPEQGLSDS